MLYLRALLFYGIHCFINPCVAFPFVFLYLDDSQANWNPQHYGGFWLSVCIPATSQILRPQHCAHFLCVCVCICLRAVCLAAEGQRCWPSQHSVMRGKKRELCEIWAQKTGTAEGWKGTTTSSQCISESCQPKVDFMLNPQDCVCYNISSNFVMNTCRAHHGQCQDDHQSLIRCEGDDDEVNEFHFY